MKKKYKLIKEYPSSPKLDTIIVEQKGQTWYEGKFNIRVSNTHVENNSEFWKKVEETPEWVVCIKESIYKNRGKLNCLYKFIEEKVFGSYEWEIESLEGTQKSERFRKATSSEVKAYKLGFHIGDRIWTKNITKAYLGKIIAFELRDGYLKVQYDDKKWSTLDNVTTKEPQEFKFEVGKWYKHKNLNTVILYKSNKDENVGFDNGFNWREDFQMEYLDNWKLANTKEIKELLLKEANRRFPIGTKYKSLCENEFLDKVFTVKESILQIYYVDTVFSESFGFVYDEGKWAEIVGEDKLMLGNIEVQIKNLVTETEDYIGYDECIWTEKGSITTKEWLTWYNTFYTIFNLNSPYFELYLDSYKTIFDHGSIEIGCIDLITLEQLEAITKAIKL